MKGREQGQRFTICASYAEGKKMLRRNGQQALVGNPQHSLFPKN
jgi:hypothetical protein